MSGNNFTVYKSSAGSGKTFTLVKEYLTLALKDERNPPQAYKHILAITFTNKAASEMKERIVKALEELSQFDENTTSSGSQILRSQLLKETENTDKPLTDNLIRHRAKNVLSAILHNYSDFAIGTIDSFVYKIVRTFAFDLRIPMSFELELDGEKLITQAVDLLVAQVGSDEDLTKALVEFTERKADDEKSWHIEKDLTVFAKSLLNEEGTVHIDKLKDLSLDDFFGIKDTLHATLSEFDSKIKKHGKEATALIKESGAAESSFASGNRGIAKYFEYLKDAKLDKLTPNKNVLKAIESDKWFSAKADDDDKSAIDAIKGRLLTIYNEAWEYIQENIQEITLLRLINTNIYSLAVLNEIEKLLVEYKEQNNVLHISEFNKMISKIVMNEPVPFIYERLGEKYDNYLIDEFQDTSVLQFHNLLPLIDNSLAKGCFTMLVGDSKQSIYRWRGGEVEQFDQLPKVFGHNDNPLLLEREEALERNYKEQLLDKNYRSKREIIEFNNDIFRVLSGKLNERFQSIYKNVEQGFLADKTGGQVQIEFLQEEQDELYEQNLLRTFEIVSDLLTENYDYKDIAVLVRRNTDGSAVANYLAQHKVPVVSSDSLLLSNSQEVSFLSALLIYLHNSDDAIVQTELLEYFVSSKNNKYSSLDAMLVERKELGFESILARICPAFDSYKLSKMALYELAEELVRLFQLNEQPNAYIQFYLDEVMHYSLKNNNNLQDFILHWEDKKVNASLVVPQGLNAVTIMTIHKSKGLEFPVVILPFSNGKNNKNGKGNIWLDIENKRIPQLQSALLPMSKALENTIYADVYDDEQSKSLLDNLNVLYVALTRPEERLYVLAAKPSKKAENFSKISDMYAYYLQKKELWEDSKYVYTIGEGKPHKKATKELVHQFEIDKFYSTQWRDSIKMRAAAASIWNLEDAESKRDYGILIHTALSKIKTGDEVGIALKAMLEEGLLTTEELPPLRETLLRIVKHPKLEDYFKDGLIVKNEAEIITATGELFRPDRVVIQDKSAVIIDYKTGEETSGHKKQILQYGDLLSQMGYNVTEKLLVYIESDEVITV